MSNDSWVLNRSRDANGRFISEDNSYESLREFIKCRIKILNDCWIWQGSIHRDGYGKCTKKPFWQSHRLSYYAFNEYIDKNLLVLHKCHNRACVSPNHLYQGTHRDNAMDTVRSLRAKKLFCAGENHPNVKLSKNIVIHIRELFKTKSVGEISKKLNLKRTTVSSICHRHSWRHL